MSFSDRVLGFGAFPNRDTDDYEIDQSLVFAGSQYLHRTPSGAGNQKTWTWSAWVKRGKLGSDYYLWSVYDGSTSSTYANIYFTSGDALAYGIWSPNQRVTTRLFRDVASWYHIMVVLDTTQSTANDRIKIYVNGVQETSFSTTNNPSEDSDEPFNAAQKHVFGDTYALDPGGTSRWFRGYMAEVHFIDGTALTPSAFGETDSDTGEWVPKEYNTSSGAYGTNGFYLKFVEGAEGTDSSGEGHNYTAVDNSSSDIDEKVMLDTPTNNFPVLNPLFPNATTAPVINEGNLVPYGRGGSYQTSVATMSVKTGAWYWEYYIGNEASGDIAFAGIVQGTTPALSTYPGYDTSDKLKGISYASGYVFGDTPAGASDGSNIVGSLANTTTGDIVGVASDIPNGTCKFYKNGSLIYTVTGIGTGFDWMPAFCAYLSASWAVVNFGQNGKFMGAGSHSGGNSDANGVGDFKYSVPSGYLALCSKNLATPAIENPADHFNTVLWSGTNAVDHDITNVGFQPDMVWIKSRSTTSGWPNIQDSVRGAGETLWTNQSDDEESWPDYFGPFLSGGYRLAENTVGNSWNTSNTYASWNWLAATAFSNDASATSIGTIDSSGRANDTAGFSIVSYTGTGSNGTIKHGLSTAPTMIIVKNRSENSRNWLVYNENIGAGDYLVLNGSDAEAAGASAWNSTSATSSVFSVGESANSNNSSQTFIAYCFAEIAGYSKIGTYVGNGNAEGTFVYTGFRPAMILIKSTSSDDWIIMDEARNTFNSTYTARLFPNSNSTESTSTSIIVDIVSNGFKFKSNDGSVNGSSETYTFLSFAASPLKYSNAR